MRWSCGWWKDPTSTLSCNGVEATGKKAEGDLQVSGGQQSRPATPELGLCPLSLKGWRGKQLLVAARRLVLNPRRQRTCLFGSRHHLSAAPRESRLYCTGVTVALWVGPGMGAAKEESGSTRWVPSHGGGGWWPVSSLTSPVKTGNGSGFAVVNLTFFKTYTNNHHPGSECAGVEGGGALWGRGNPKENEMPQSHTERGFKWDLGQGIGMLDAGEVEKLPSELLTSPDFASFALYISKFSILEISVSVKHTFLSSEFGTASSFKDV